MLYNMFQYKNVYLSANSLLNTFFFCNYFSNVVIKQICT